MTVLTHSLRWFYLFQVSLYLLLLGFFTLGHIFHLDTIAAANPDDSCVLIGGGMPGNQTADIGLALHLAIEKGMDSHSSSGVAQADIENYFDIDNAFDVKTF